MSDDDDALMLLHYPFGIMYYVVGW